MTAPDVVARTTDAGDPEGSGAHLTTSDPFTQDEYDAIVHAIFDGLDGDPWRVGDLLADALGFIGGLAVRTDHHVADRAAGLLRRMEQRALWGPDEPCPEVRP